ncbi:MAG TPA: cytochrome c [Rhizomicrobium sp.]|nr:cytochrome c [Rhizomicrobium sp.]HWC64284.1 cytochrome c [Rhizomicrobium sp.]
MTAARFTFGRWLATAAISAAAIAGLSGLTHAQVGAMRSVWDGVYTAAQADRGKTLFGNNCAKCHGETLAGMDEIPPLQGPHFMADWQSETIAGLVQRIHNTMPLDNPGALSTASSTDVVAYLLQQNQIPAGTTDLPVDASMQSQIRIDPNKPGT